MATRSSILAQKIPWTEEPGGLQSSGSQTVGRNWAHTHAWTLGVLILLGQTQHSWTSSKRMRNLDFPSDPVVKTVCLQCRGQGFNPWSANWVPKCPVAKKKQQQQQKKLRKKKKREKLKSSENSFQCCHYYLLSLKSSFKCFLSSISSCRIILYTQGIYNPPWTYFPLRKCYRDYILILMRFLLRDKKGIQTHLYNRL